MMNVTGGSYDLGPDSGRLLVKTARTGFGSRAGHDLTIEATRWRGTVAIDTAVPADSTVRVEVDVESLEVREGTGGIKPLTDSDRAEIRKTLRAKILHTDRHPTITFASTSVTADGESFRVDGDLTIVGVTHPVAVHGRLADGRAHGGATVTQSRWGIRPYSAFLGALKLKDEVEVEFDIDLVG